MPSDGLVPPGLSAFVMLAPRPHHHARSTFGRDPRLHGVTVENEPVNPFGKCAVTQRFERGGMLAPALVIAGGERLGANDALAIDMTGRGHTAAGLHRAAAR